MYWKLAMVQHPMYLLIKEDSQCYERMVEGQATIEQYIGRLRRNMAALRRFPQLTIGFEWSGLELEMLAEDAPDVFADMCLLAREGRATFYNGTYSQPHLQTLGSESNYRQFVYGMRVYDDLCHHPVRTYAHQEASVHDQTPQLLQAFDIEYGVVPRFFSTLAWLDESEQVLIDRKGPRFVHGHEFVSWSGLDGTAIPLYLAIPESGTKELDDFVAIQAQAGRLHQPPILMTVPDLTEIDENWLAERRFADIVLLDQAIEERLQKFPPRSRARFFSN